MAVWQCTTSNKHVQIFDPVSLLLGIYSSISKEIEKKKKFRSKMPVRFISISKTLVCPYNKSFILAIISTFLIKKLKCLTRD